MTSLIPISIRSGPNWTKLLIFPEIYYCEKYNGCLEKGSDQRDQLIVTLYILSIYPSIHKQLI